MKFYYAVICTAMLLVICCHKTLAGGTFNDPKSRDECMLELKLSPDEMNIIKNNQMITKDKKTAPKNMQCYSACYLKKLNVINDKNEINEKVLAEILTEAFKSDQNRVKTAIDKCKLTTGADNCEKVFNIDVCLRDQM